VTAAPQPVVPDAETELNRYYMACLDLRGRRCLVVGGGRVAHEKACGLLAAGAIITIVALDVAPELETLPLEIRRRAYETADINGHVLVIAATSDTAVNRQVFDDAERRAVFCNVADVPELCSFILPAVHREGPIAIAVSTGGASPALAQRLRSDIGQIVGPRHARLAEKLRALRPWAQAELSTYEERRDFFAALVEKELA
jgi:siroheme synthase-like protein